MGTSHILLAHVVSIAYCTTPRLYYHLFSFGSFTQKNLVTETPGTNISRYLNTRKKHMKKIITPCGGDYFDNEFILHPTMGIRSGYTAMILKAVSSEKVRNYEASIYKWVTIPALPMTTGV